MKLKFVMVTSLQKVQKLEAKCASLEAKVRLIYIGIIPKRPVYTGAAD